MGDLNAGAQLGQSQRLYISGFKHSLPVLGQQCRLSSLGSIQLAAVNHSYPAMLQSTGGYLHHIVSLGLLARLPHVLCPPLRPGSESVIPSHLDSTCLSFTFISAAINCSVLILAVHSLGSGPNEGKGSGRWGCLYVRLLVGGIVGRWFHEIK